VDHYAGTKKSMRGGSLNKTDEIKHKQTIQNNKIIMLIGLVIQVITSNKGKDPKHKLGNFSTRTQI
jgi:hypothetical protein